MRDVMLDLETLGTRHDAMIISIGAVYFDREKGGIGRGFSANIDPGIHGDKFTVDYGTVKWWFQQSDAARKLVMEAPMPLRDALEALRVFLEEPGGILLWSHATFDMPILQNAYEALHMDFPIPFRNTRDLRTLMDLSRHLSETPRTGTHHHALDDAKFQAMYGWEAIQKLNGTSRS